MHNDPHDAHYLHRRKGLDPVLQLPFEGARVLGSVASREVILVGDASGCVHAVDPAMGASVWVQLDSAPIALGASSRGKRLVVLTEDGAWHLFDRDGAQLESGEHRLTHGLYVWSDGGRLVAGGQGDDGASVWVWDDEAREHTLPAGSALLNSDHGLQLAWVAEGGVCVAPWDDSAPMGAPGAVRERVWVSGAHLAWAGESEVGVQSVTGSPPVRIPWVDCVTAAVGPLGVRALVTSGAGEVGLVELASDDTAPHVVELDEQVVGAAQFSARGPWVATLGDDFRLWTWHEG